MSPESVRRRVVVLGLDGATWDLLSPWIEQGYLPNLARLRVESAWGTLMSTIPPFSVAAWTTFATGMNPGKHGVFDFWGRNANGARFPITSGSVRAPTLWRRLSEAGLRVLVMGVPVTYPPSPVNGIMVSGMLTPPKAPNFTHPPALAQELQAQVGLYRPDPYRAITQSTGFLREAIYWTEQQERAYQYLAKSEPWDFSIQVIQASDVIQHYFWTFLQPGHPDFASPRGTRYRELTIAAFRHMDNIIGTRADQLRGDDILILMSDHGAGEATHWFNLNHFLGDAGFQVTRNGRRLIGTRLAQESILDSLRRLDVLNLRGRFLNRTRLKFRQQVDRLVASPIDWTHTRAYAAGTSAEAIYLNVRGREPQGIVEPGAEYERVRDDVMAAINAVRDPTTDQPVFAGVHRREDLFTGPYIHLAPDILLEVGDKPYIMADRLGSTGVFERIPQRAARGRHRPNGFLLVHGAGIRSQAQMAGARLQDLAPTILALLGQPIPQDMDGRILAELFSYRLDTAPSASQLTEGDEAHAEQTIADTGYTAEEAAWVEKRLRSLGYLE